MTYGVATRAQLGRLARHKGDIATALLVDEWAAQAEQRVTADGESPQGLLRAMIPRAAHKSLPQSKA